MNRSLPSEWRSIKVPNINCGSGNRIYFVCINKDCLFDAYTCVQDNCETCSSLNHKDCGKFQKFSHLVQKVEKKVNQKVTMLKNIFEIQEKLIKQLRESRQKLIVQKEDKNSQEMERLIQSVFQQKNIKGFTGSTMSSLVQQLIPSKVQQEKKKQLEKFKKEGENMIEELTGLREEIFDSLMSFSWQLESEILSRAQKNYLLAQLKNFRRIELLFRASQHDFSAAEFHKYCDGVSDTLTIVRTQFDRTIAAYTPLQWSSPEKGEYVIDSSESSFLLQLDLKEKMNLIIPQYTICNNAKCGPIFGGGHDLKIANQCNQNQKSCSNFPHSYNFNHEYPNNQESITAFCGSENDNKFGVVEYEVFALSK